jgi:hypothetical protein
MKAKKVKNLTDKGYIIIEVTEDTTVLRGKNGDIAKIDNWGKVLWYPVNT